MSVRQITVPIVDFREGFVRIGGQSAERTRTIAMAGICVGLLVPLCLVGCETNSSGDKGPQHPHHTHVHQHPTFAESVAQVRSRSVRFTSNQGSTDAALAEWKKQKLLEFIRQLPELAADTDLKKKEWDRVNAISKELLGIMKPRDAASNHGSPFDSDRFAVLIAELETMAASNQSLDF